MIVDFARIQDAAGFSALPEDKYLCRVDQVDVATSRKGDPMWKITFVVVNGPYQGRRVFDRVAFSRAACGRLKHVCHGLGLDVSGVINLTPDELRDRECYLDVHVAQYQTSDGSTRLGNEVAFMGYSRVESVSTDTARSRENEDENRGDAVPF